MKSLSQQFTRPKFAAVHLLGGIVIGVTLGIVAFQLFLAERESSSQLETVAPSIEGRASPFDETLATLTSDECFEYFRGSNWSSHFEKLNGLGEERLVDLIHQCAPENDSSLQLNDLQELLVGKLAQSNPAQALEEVWGYPRSRWSGLLMVVFAEWSVLDAKEAITAARRLNEPYRTSLLRFVLGDLIASSNQDLEAQTADRDLAFLVALERSEANAMQLLRDPKQAWDLVIQDGVPDTEQESLLKRIAESFLQRRNFEVLDLLIDDLLKLDYRLVDRILESVVAHDEHEAFDHALSMSSDRQRSFLLRLISLWSQHDPHAAINATFRIPKSSDRSLIQSQLVATWAKQNPLELLSNVQRVHGQLQQKFVLYAIREIARFSPTEAANELSQLRTIMGSIDDSTELVLVTTWAETNPADALKWVNENSEKGTQIHARMMQRVLTQFALVDFNKAMDFALSEKPHAFHGRTGLESEVIGSLAQSGELDSAISLLERVRPSARPLSFMRVGIGLIEFDRTAEAIELSQQLSEEEQLGYFRNISGVWFSIKPNELLASLKTLPSQEAALRIAQNILWEHNNVKKSLTSEQVTYLQSYLDQAKDRGRSD